MAGTEPTTRTQAQRSALSDSRLVNAAIRLIVERGTEKTTLRALGEAAGYSRGLAGYRFGSKQGLFEFVMHAVGEQWLEQLSHATRGVNGIEAMRAAVQAHCDLCCSNAAPVRAFYILWMGAVSPGSETSDVVTNIDQRRQHDVAQWVFEANADASQSHTDAVAALFSATIIGIVYHWLANPDNQDAVKAQHDQLIQTMAQLMQPGKQS